MGQEWDNLVIATSFNRSEVCKNSEYIKNAILPYPREIFKRQTGRQQLTAISVIDQNRTDPAMIDGKSEGWHILPTEAKTKNQSISSHTGSGPVDGTYVYPTLAMMEICLAKIGPSICFRSFSEIEFRSHRQPMNGFSFIRQK
eukprot:TRINITY_DN11486_c0_g1_i2.p3 TRINITY_DN11486_c0_g1~~TRINITY_DN11486_c0_g1_i2.p3  ORF type:complete len:143 (+),score=2.93 TRINITY_DN11486_c0_g1_i2:1206-1634(+)